MLSVDLGTLTLMPDRLLCKGWIERLPNPNDKRRVVVQLTPEGKALWGHSLGQYIRNRKLTEIAQKLKESDEPIIYLAGVMGLSHNKRSPARSKTTFPCHHINIASCT